MVLLREASKKYFQLQTPSEMLISPLRKIFFGSEKLLQEYRDGGYYATAILRLFKILILQ